MQHNETPNNLMALSHGLGSALYDDDYVQTAIDDNIIE